MNQISLFKRNSKPYQIIKPMILKVQSFTSQDVVSTSSSTPLKAQTDIK
jgi:hypothetical protein